MESEQFSLCWNNFHSNLSSGFHNLLKEEDLVDVTLAAGGKYLKAHKTVLSVCSPYFKELFRANPCKHPIVILQDVNYDALCSLLQFMYQGEVSVSQEEIPTFMKVAETLKVKGLTDNSSNTESNGSLERSFLAGQKRSRPVKKPVRPIQMQTIQLQNALRTSDGAKVVRSPQPPSKKPHLEENSSTPTQKQNEADNNQFVTPKLEPVDADNEDDPNFDENFDMNSMLETTMEKPIEPPQGWNPIDAAKAQDTSTPGSSTSSPIPCAPSPNATSITILRSSRGQPVLVHNGHLYTVYGTNDPSSHTSKCLWVCVKKKMYNCEGCVTTLGGPFIVSYASHNHPQLHEIIDRLRAQQPSTDMTL